MFLNAWSISLTICSIVVLFLLANAAWTGIKVLRFWNPASDGSLQISLENETWLSSTLVEYALFVQGLSLLLFVLAADNYSDVIAGAMCATGSLLANQYGLPTLYVKLAGVFLYGFWILLHQLDIRSEVYPLVNLKYVYLLLLMPVILTDAVLQTLYIANLDPDIITSCCAVVLSETTGEGGNLLASLPQNLMLVLYYGTMPVLIMVGILIQISPSSGLITERRHIFLSTIYSLGWLWFFGLALATVTSVISSYIYAMPFHRCPFCIVKQEYCYIGLAIYATLICGAFFGISIAPAEIIGRRFGLSETTNKYRKAAACLSIILLLILASLSSYHYLAYLMTGGES